MKKREQLEATIKAKQAQINQLQTEINELKKECIFLCDDKQWYSESTETQTVGKGKNKEEQKFHVCWIHWNEPIKDEDTGEVILIERKQAVRVDGVWRT